jgi:O-antigen/teichoic acid export membrane protein
MFNLILIPRWGIIGAAFASVITITIISIVRLIQVYWLVKVWPYNAAYFKPLISAAIALIVGFLMNQLFPAESNMYYFILNVVIMWSGYVIVNVLLGLTEEDHVVLNHAGSRFTTVLSGVKWK